MSSDVQNDGIFCQLPILEALPNELAIQCLARLPRRDRAIARCVSRSWRDVLSPNHLKSFCQVMGIRVPAEDWLYMSYKVYPSRTLAHIVVDPLTMQKHPVTVVDPPPGESIRSLAVRDHLSVVKCKYDCLELYWLENNNNKDFECILRRAKPMIEAKRRDYAWAVMGNFVYVAGGFRDGDRNALRSAERFDMEKQRWEMLPPMVEKARFCSGYVMKRKFYVVYAIYSSILNSRKRIKLDKTQYFDPKSRQWTALQKSMWEYTSVPLNHPIDKPKVAVVQNKLYQKGENGKSVWEYSPSANLWEERFIVVASKSMDSYIYDLACVGEQLWIFINCWEAVIPRFGSRLVAHKPTEHGKTNIKLKIRGSTFTLPRLILFSHDEQVDMGVWRVEPF